MKRVLHDDAPPPPKGAIPRDGVEYGCGVDGCTACYEPESVCIIDFCGNSRQPGMWCDYWIEQEIVTFGGYWRPVPDMPSKNAPTEDQCEAWASRFKDQCEMAYNKWIDDSVKEEQR